MGVSSYLLRNLAITRVNQVWGSDITYIPVRRGFMYLVAVMDWYGRYVLAWQLSNTLDSAFCLDALQQALNLGKPAIWNTDQDRLRDRDGSRRIATLCNLLDCGGRACEEWRHQSGVRKAMTHPNCDAVRRGITLHNAHPQATTSRGVDLNEASLIEAGLSDNRMMGVDVRNPLGIDERFPVNYTRAIVPRLGGSEVLQITEDELPEPGPGEVRVRILAAGVSFADILMREGVHIETPRTPFTPGWDLVGVVEKRGDGVSRFDVGQMVAALPVTGGYAEYICLPQEELTPVPAGLDPAEAVGLVLNYVTAYQMMHRSARVVPRQRVLVHAAAGGIGTALLQLGRLIDLDMYGTASPRKHETVSSQGAVPIDYRQVDFVEEVLRLTGDGVDVVFDGIGGTHLWRSVKTLRAGGKVVAYGLTSSLRDGRLAHGRRHKLRGLVTFGAYIVATAFLPGRKRMKLYSIQTLKRWRPAWFREDLTTLLELLRDRKIKPIIAARIPLAEVVHAHEMLGTGSVTGRIVLLCNG